MRIISKFRDYYDSAQGFGADGTRPFVRKEEVIAKKPEDVPAELKDHLGSTWDWESGMDKTMRLIPIVFCGKLYHGLALTFRDRPKGNHIYGEPVTSVQYDEKTALDWLDAKGQQDMRAALQQRFSNGRVSLKNQGKPLACDWLAENKAAILVANTGAWEAFLTKNANLGVLQFYKVFNAPQAYQELDMYLSGILAAENKPMTQISDQIRAQQHGFDCYSFRQPPSKRKAKQCHAGK